MFNKPEAVEALKFLAELKPYSLPYDGFVGDTIPFTKGNSVMAYMNPGFLSSTLTAHPDWKDKIGVLSFVPGKAKAAFCGAKMFAMPTSIKNKVT